MQNAVFVLGKFDLCRPHETLASRQPIARIDIHMLAKETARTIIGIAIPRYGFAAALTGKILVPPLEFFRREYFCHARIIPKVSDYGFWDFRISFIASSS